MAYFRKTVDGLDYWTIDWTNDLASNETVSTTEWTAESGLVIERTQNEPLRSTVYISAGVEGSVQKINCKMTTSTGRVLEQLVFVGIHP